tara:strand:- start:951 stop:1814 length:864 start_codon:yes stop_codon:yes gene_type:complete
MLNHHEINAAIKIINDRKRDLKPTKALISLHDRYSVGLKKSGQQGFSYRTRDYDVLLDLLTKQGINPKTYSSAKGSREQRGLEQTREKKGARSIMPSPVCFKPLSGTPSINGQSLALPLLGHLQIDAEAVLSVETEFVLIVENLETFVNLHRINLEGLPRTVLAIWRGGPVGHISTPNTEKLVQQWQKNNRFKIAGYYDYDLQGFILTARKMFNALVLPEPGHLEGIIGNSEDYNKQEDGSIRQQTRLSDFPWLHEHIKYIKDRKESFTQERLMGFNRKLFWRNVNA